jgi:hypothetical protein
MSGGPTYSRGPPKCPCRLVGTHHASEASTGAATTTTFDPSKQCDRFWEIHVHVQPSSIPLARVPDARRARGALSLRISNANFYKGCDYFSGVSRHTIVFLHNNQRGTTWITEFDNADPSPPEGKASTAVLAAMRWIAYQVFHFEGQGSDSVFSRMRFSRQCSIPAVGREDQVVLGMIRLSEVLCRRVRRINATQPMDLSRVSEVVFTHDLNQKMRQQGGGVWYLRREKLPEGMPPNISAFETCFASIASRTGGLKPLPSVTDISQGEHDLAMDSLQFLLTARLLQNRGHLVSEM